MGKKDLINEFKESNASLDGIELSKGEKSIKRKRVEVRKKKKNSGFRRVGHFLSCEQGRVSKLQCFTLVE